MGEQFQCPNCGQLYGLSPEQLPRYAGQTISCTRCGRAFLVPMEIVARGQPAAVNITQSAPPPPMPPMLPATQTSNGWAAAGTGFAVLGLIVPIVCSLLAIGLGLLGLRRTRHPLAGGKGMSITAIVLGVLGIPLGAFYVSRALPLLEQMREADHRSQCAARLAAIGVAMRQYARDNGGNFPDRLESLPPGDMKADALLCPSATEPPPPVILSDGRRTAFIYTGAGLTQTASAETVLLYEPLRHHLDEGINVLFADGRVQFIGRIEAAKAFARLRKGQNPPWTTTEN
ncbi:MAG: hypothetical protein ABIP55_16480 [Tepidisphaeraceae bacterium]